MLPRTKQLIDQIPKSSYRNITTPQKVKAIFSKNHVHPVRAFEEIEWYNYIIIDTNNETHQVQLVFVEPGNYRNSLYCQTCQGLCDCAIVAMIDFISKQDPLPDQPVCEGCGKVLH